MCEHPVLADIRIQPRRPPTLGCGCVKRTASPASRRRKLHSHSHSISGPVRPGPVLRHLNSAQFAFLPPLTLLITLNMGLLTWFKKVCSHYLLTCVDESLILSAERARRLWPNSGGSCIGHPEAGDAAERDSPARETRYSTCHLIYLCGMGCLSWPMVYPAASTDERAQA